MDEFRAAGPQQFIVLSTDGMIGGNFAQTDFTTAGFQSGEWQLIQTNNSVVLSFTPVPEPGAMLAIATRVLREGVGVRRLCHRPAQGSEPPCPGEPETAA